MYALLCTALLLLFYTYVGYPVLIAFLARWFPRSVRRNAEYLPKVSAIIPAYNAESYIDAKIKSLLEQDYPKELLEILVCSDASDDGTDESLAKWAKKDKRVKPLRAAERSGKPSAVNLMKSLATGEVLLMTDIRQPLSKDAIRNLVIPLADPEVACTSGNLVLKGSAGAGMYWRYENWIRQSEGTFRSMVGVTGPLYAIRKDDMDELPSDIILDDMWVPMRLRLDGRRIIFVPEAVAYDDAFEDDRELGRKVRTLAGNYQLFEKLPGLLFPIVNPSWFEVMSHKVLRLICPWALMILFLSSVFVACGSGSGCGKSMATWLLVGQLGFYAAALAGKKLGAIGRFARTFVVLHYAAVAGLTRHLRGSQKVTW